MAKRVFFSFHYQDVITFRANVVRNHGAFKENERAGYFDASIWEESKKKGDISLKRLINGGLDNTSVTCVLIGSDTFQRRWVRYEIFKSFEKGNSILGVHINGIRDKNSQTFALGKNPLDYLSVTFSQDGKKGELQEWNGSAWITYNDLDSISYGSVVSDSLKGKSFQLSQFYKTYDWIANNGSINFGSWV
jgi:hypothetical protein